MLRGELVALRARLQTDVPILHAGLEADVVTRSRAGSRAWAPVSIDSAESPYAVDSRPADAALFSVVTLADEELVGEAVLWGIDNHNRLAHIGMSLLSASRGRGFGADVVAVLCHYGFVVRGLHRLQIDTLADNAAMIGAARKSGFVHEATLRDAAWVLGGFADEVVYGLLADEWKPSGSQTTPQ